MALLNLIEPENIRSEAERTTIRPIGAELAATYIVDSLSAIVAAGKKGEIGFNGDMPWHIPADLKRFKSITLGHPVIMGRRTWESLGIRPLPGRLNIVITRSAAYNAPGAQKASSLFEALEMVKGLGESFIIGGGEVYKEAMPFINRIYLTSIQASFPEADTFFALPTEDSWMRVEQSERYVTPDGVGFTFETWLRNRF